MTIRPAATIAALLVLLPGIASAHRIDEYLQATLLTLKPHTLQGSMRLVPGVLVASSVIAAIDTSHDGAFSPEEQRAYAQQATDAVSVTVDGQPVEARLVSFSFPSEAQIHAGLGEIIINYVAPLVDRQGEHVLIVANRTPRAKAVYMINTMASDDHSVQVLRQLRNPPQSIYELHYLQIPGAAEKRNETFVPFRGWIESSQFLALFHLGMHHIAEGTDHLLFLLTLLLPAPLLALRHRWGPPLSSRRSLLRILGIVTAFTIGHSVTLTLAAMNVISVPGSPIEVLIAGSILVSAIHALRPIAPGREAWIAGFFGLIHGLAFAATLDRLGLGRWQRVAGILSFNLGIEAMQMIVIAAILPSLLLLSRTRAYSALRIGGAASAAFAALAWTVERLFDIPLPVDSLVDALARHATWIAAGLFLISLLAHALLPDTTLAERKSDVLSQQPTASLSTQAP